MDVVLDPLQSHCLFDEHHGRGDDDADEHDNDHQGDDDGDLVVETHVAGRLIAALVEEAKGTHPVLQKILCLCLCLCLCFFLLLCLCLITCIEQTIMPVSATRISASYTSKVEVPVM